MQQLTNCYYILNFCSNCRYRCATFGQQFVFDNGSFYDDFSVECRADQTWSAATIPHQCACEYFLQHQLKQDLSLSLRVKVCQPTKAWCSAEDDCLLEPRLSSGSQRGDYLQVRCWTTLQQVWIWPQAHVKDFAEHCWRSWFWIHCFSCFGLMIVLETLLHLHLWWFYC